MMYLLQSFTRNAQISHGRFRRFFDKAMEDDDSLTHHGAKERTPNALNSSRPDFKQTVAHRSCVRQPKVWAMLHYALDNGGEVGRNPCWPS